MSDEDRCRCGHHRAHHLNVCKAMRPVGVGSTPPGFQQRTERCPCLGFALWQTADKDAGSVGAVTAAFLLCLVGISLFLLAVIGGQHAMCATNHDGAGHGALSYCADYQGGTR